MRHVILIDLASFYYAAWHASADQEISEAYNRTLSAVRRHTEKADLVAICCDWGPYWRHELAPDYKANRAALPEVAREQYARVQARLKADGLLVWKCKGFESDDLLATACDRALSDGLSVTIVSGDKDLLGCISEHVRVIKAQTGEVFGVEQVVEKFGVQPHQMRDLLALMGDTADHVPGIPKVGVKTAAELLRKFGDIDTLFARCDEVTPPKLAAAIVEHADRVRLSRKLVTLRTDAPITWEEIYEERMPESLIEDAEYEDDAEDAPPDEISGGDPFAPKEEETVKTAEKLPAAAAQDADVKRPKTITALAKTEPENWSLALEPRSFNGAWALARLLFNSRLYQQFQTPEAICAVLMRGRELGLGAATSLASFHVVEGRPTMAADLIRGLVLSSGKCDFFDLVETSREKATWTTRRKGSERSATITWTMQDALAAGLVTRNGNEYRGISRSGKPSNWDKYPRTMLRHRAGVELARAVYPDVVSGLYTPDEITDGDTVIDATFEETGS